MESLPLVLLVQDTTDLDFSHRHKMSGLGAIGDGNGRGMYLQTVLALDPDSREVLGCAYQRPFMRIPAPSGETRAQRRKREKETDVWHQCAQQIGSSSASSLQVHVADRGSDIFGIRLIFLLGMGTRPVPPRCLCRGCIVSCCHLAMILVSTNFLPCPSGSFACGKKSRPKEKSRSNGSC